MGTSSPFLFPPNPISPSHPPIHASSFPSIERRKNDSNARNRLCPPNNIRHQRDIHKTAAYHLPATVQDTDDGRAVDRELLTGIRVLFSCVLVSPLSWVHNKEGMRMGC